MTTKTFMEYWQAITKEVTHVLGRHRRLYNGILEIQITESDRPDMIRINSIKSLDCQKGYMRAFLKKITAEADKHKVSLSACVQPWGHSFEKRPDKEILKGAFVKAGFAVNFEYPNEGYEMITVSD